MLINKHNLTIVEHCASKELSGYITNGLQFTKTGTMAINRCYSVAVSALKVVDGEPHGCITREDADALLKATLDQTELALSNLRYMKGKSPKIILPEKPALFEITLSANFLLKLAQSVRDFTGPEEDAIVRVSFTGQAEPIKMDARNTATGQKWEALLMPRVEGEDAARFAEPVSVPVPPPPPPVPAASVPPPPPPTDNLAEAIALAQKLAGL